MSSEQEVSLPITPESSLDHTCLKHCKAATAVHEICQTPAWGAITRKSIGPMMPVGSVARKLGDIGSVMAVLVVTAVVLLVLVASHFPWRLNKMTLR